MKHLRLGGLVAMMAVAAAVLVAAGTASATVLCKEQNNPCESADYPAGTALSADSVHRRKLRSNTTTPHSRTYRLEDGTASGGRPVFRIQITARETWPSSSTVTRRSKEEPGDSAVGIDRAAGGGSAADGDSRSNAAS